MSSPSDPKKPAAGHKPPSAAAAAAAAAAGKAAPRVSVRHRAAKSVTITSNAAEKAIEKVLERRELKRQGKLPPPKPAPTLLQSVTDEINFVIRGSLAQFGLPQWAFRVLVLVVVTAVMGVAVAKIALRDGPPCPVHPLSGSLTIRGAVPVGASVILHPQGHAIPGDGVPMARVREDGTFAFSTFAADDGAPAGDYVATVQWYRVNADGSVGGNAVPARFASPAKSPWTVTVAAGGTSLAPYQITR
ncbi:MAG: hypothetical protein ACK6CT_02910 [Planctomycetia bacterium]|jgi:hypothetical protein